MLTTLPRHEGGASTPADAADDLITDPGSHHKSIHLHAKRPGPVLTNILTSTRASGLLSPSVEGQPSTGSNHTTRAGAMSLARVAYGPVDDTDGPRDEEQRY